MEIIKHPKSKYDPFNLPKAIDFHLAMKKIDLPRGTKTKIQIAISKMDRRQIKETIEYLNDMRYTAMNHEDYKMAAYCESVKNLVDEYFKSIKAQNRI